MGVGAALKLRDAVELLETVLSLELLAAAQGLEFLRPLAPGSGIAMARDHIRERVAPLERDRDISPDIAAIVEMVRSGEFAGIWRVIDEPA
jgi:histidine ammonia-lyase